MAFTCKRLFISDSKKPLVDIRFEIKHSLALVGQSGSGKSLTLKALLNLLPSSLHVELEYESSFKLTRGENVAFVPQNPFTSLSPLTRIKNQFFHENAKEYVREVGLNPSLLERYPSELSGGQLQRVIIAMALSISPKLILLDEPTTALDASSRSIVLEILAKEQEKLGFLTLFVTHDIRSAAKVCREIAVLKDGTILEYGLMNDVLKAPAHPYTKVLLNSGFTHRGFRQ
jgi:peptide/nickel transport system ATP-binding protein